MLVLAQMGDGAIVRAALDAMVEFLKRFAAPTGARGSVLFMWGGLIIIGFLFMTFLFRSAIVGDLAPVANGRTPMPRVLLPGMRSSVQPLRLASSADRSFDGGRLAARDGRPRDIDAALGALHASGFDARVVLSGPEHKRVRAYLCPACGEGSDLFGCEYARGLLAGAFEAITDEVTKVEEVACRHERAPYCEFIVHHARRIRVVA